MREEYRTEWPSQAHLDELRERGKAPYSSAATRSACLIATLLMVPALNSTARSAFELYNKIIRAGGFELAALKALCQAVLPLLIIPVSVVALTICLMGLAQTRFMLSFSNLTLDLSRLARVRSSSFAARFLSTSAAAFVICVLGVCFCCWTAYPLFDLLNGDESSLALFYQKLFRHSAKFFLPFAALVCVAGWLGSRLWFMHFHRMTRQEVEAEARER